MKRIVRTLGVATVASLAWASAAQAHFQLLYTPNVNLSKAGNIPLRLIFWHPMECGHAMDMGEPEQFFVVTKDGKKDLKASLKPVTFKGPENSAKAFAADFKVTKSGDYVFGLVPAPYYEKSEDVYIQQITKSFVNKGEMPTNWNEPVGLPAEIVPLNKPTAIMTGSTFSGQVISQGKPVAGAELEIEYLAAPPNPATNAPAGKPSVKPAAGGTVVATTDANGVFTFGIPKAGFWGFAALGVGPEKTFKGKELSQDAVLWIHATDLK